jgi:hypothetical protein
MAAEPGKAGGAASRAELLKERVKKPAACTFHARYVAEAQEAMLNAG